MMGRREGGWGGEREDGERVRMERREGGWGGERKDGEEREGGEEKGRMGRRE